MTWLILSLIAPFLWSIANYVDKYILSKTPYTNGGSGGLVILSSVVSFFVALILFFKNGTHILQLNMWSIFVLLLAGTFELLYVYFYFLALEIESTSTVITLFQFAPVFGVLFGFIFIHEIPSLIQCMAILIILTGTLCLVIEKNEINLKYKVIKLMGVSTLFVGLYGTFFKMAGESLPLWTAVFWEYIGISLAGLLFFIFSKQNQSQFFAMLKGKAVALTSVAEFLNIGAILATNAAVLLAPVGLVLSISSVQPVFVLIEGVLLSIILPQYFKNDRPKIKPKYIIGILLVVIGGFLIY